MVEIENDSGFDSPTGRIRSGSFEISPIHMVTGPAASALRTISGLFPSTLAKSLCKSSAAASTACGSSGARRRVSVESMMSDSCGLFFTAWIVEALVEVRYAATNALRRNARTSAWRQEENSFTDEKFMIRRSVLFRALPRS